MGRSITAFRFSSWRGGSVPMTRNSCWPVLLHDVGKAIDPADHVTAALLASRGSIHPAHRLADPHHMEPRPSVPALWAKARGRLQQSEYYRGPDAPYRARPQGPGSWCVRLRAGRGPGVSPRAVARGIRRRPSVARIVFVFLARIRVHRAKKDSDVASIHAPTGSSVAKSLFRDYDWSVDCGAAA